MLRHSLPRPLSGARPARPAARSPLARPRLTWMSLIQPLCDSTGSQDSAITFAPLLANSGTSAATTPSSVVHTGVKSAGWENRTPQLHAREGAARA